ncbi:MAG: hypothetical protein NT150_01025, partial [Bacteroidetes bacterium]|nr:hypothetical protein [Bacteroidota bacterium]
MKGKFLWACALLFSCYSSAYSQCSTVPVKQAVRNGDFEAGYLGGTIFSGNASPSAAHPAAGSGGAMDFTSDMKYGGMWSPTGGCKYSLANQYGVGRVENPACLNGNKQVVYGQYAGGGLNYVDHTTGTDQGFSLICDFDNGGADAPVGLYRKVWAQTVPVYPSQNYWFSAWFALYTQEAPPTMRFRVEFLDAGNAIISNNPGGTVSPTTAWTFQQMKTSFTSPINAVKANIYIECDPTGQASSDDFFVDDISFINSCQDISSISSYTVKFAKDSVNLCSEGGSYLAQILKNNGTSLSASGKTITWYKGSTSPQTEITAWANQVNPSITATGEYRACVHDVPNGCDVSATIIAYESVSYTPPNVTLCSPAQYTYDAGYTFPNGAMTIAWSGPSGAGSGQTYIATKAGSHTVTISPAGGHAGCALTKTFTVTSNLPVAPTNLDYCDGGGSSTTLTMGDGKPYRWSTSQTMSPLIGSGNSVTWTPAGGTTGDQTLWMQSAGTTPLGTVGPTAIAGYAAVRPVEFTTTGSTVLSSFIVNVPGYACAWGTTSMPVTFGVTGQAAYTQNVNCGSNTTITPNWTLAAGTYTLSTTSTDLLTGSGGPTTAGAGKVTIINAPSDGLYTMGNLTFSNSDACDPIPVTVKAKSCCTPPTDSPDIDLVTSVLSVCAPSKATIVSKSGLTNGLDYKWQVSHDNGTTWKDTLATGTVAGGKVTLANVASTGSYRLVVATAGNIGKSCVKNSPAAVVNIKPLPTGIAISVAPNQTTFCKGVAHVLTATATTGATFQWKYDGTGTASTTNGLTTVGTHKYKVIATLNGCVDSSAATNLTVNAL